MSALNDHLQSGATTVCRAWALLCADGVSLGFTDHDRALAFDGISFRPETGMTASTLEQSTGLAVDNAEAIGVLCDQAITEVDIFAGRYDGAELRLWLVNWAAPDERALQFRGLIGEIRRAGGAFEAELRSFADLLNQPRGRVYQRGCTAVLGDGACGVDTSDARFRAEGQLAAIEGQRVLTLRDVAPHAADWFLRGSCQMLGGSAAGQSGAIRKDCIQGDTRVIELWEPLAVLPDVGDAVAVIAGCDKLLDSCRYKFENLYNFQGFPDLPGEDWLMRYPGDSEPKDGGSRR